MYSRETTIREFNGKAPVYESNRLAPWYKALSERILTYLAPHVGDVVLDIGSGTGYLLRRVAEKYPGVMGIGIDVAPRMVEVARQKAQAENFDNLYFVQADWERQSPDARRLIIAHQPQFVICSHTLHYFFEPQQALADIWGVIRPGGEVLILERAKERSLLTHVWDYIHRFLIKDDVRFYDTNSLRDMLEQAGFCDAEVRFQLNRLVWKRKLYTAVALISALR